MSDEVKNETELSGKMKIVELLLGSTRYKVVLAAFVVNYLIVNLVVGAKTVSAGVLEVALWGLWLTNGLAAVHVILRTCWKGKNGSDKRTDMPGDEDTGPEA